MLNKIIISVNTPDGVKEASIVKADNVGYVFFDNNNDFVHYCDSDVTLFSFIQFFIDDLKNYPSYENKKF